MNLPLSALNFLRMPLGRLLGTLLWLAGKFSILVLGVVTWAQLRTPLPTARDVADAAVADPWFWTILVATLLATFNPGARLAKLSRLGNQKEHRSNCLVTALSAVRSGLRPVAKAQFDKAREHILMAAETELREALEISDLVSIKANFLVAVDKHSVEVVARSRPGSPTGVIYPHDDRMAVTKCMSENATTSVGNVRRFPEYADKPYAAVVATPVASGAKAFGALTADSPDKHLFTGKETMVDRILRPYAAMLLLTLPKNCASYSCPERYI